VRELGKEALEAVAEGLRSVRHVALNSQLSGNGSSTEHSEELRSFQQQESHAAFQDAFRDRDMAFMSLTCCICERILAGRRQRKSY